VAGRLREEFWNLPNVLTLGRIAIIPVFAVFTDWGDPLHSFYAAALFSLAAITDVVDGFLARRLNLVTVLGKFMDPVADKLIVMAALVLLVRLGRVEPWLVIVLLAREFIVSGLRTVAMSEGLVIAASQEGKWKTSTQLCAIIALLVHYRHEVDFVFFKAAFDFNRIGRWLLWMSVALSVISAVGYFMAFLKVIAKSAEPAPTTGKA
jgi:CDP-diacylglycerol---glycerol-3-phosphate 3-phosphatidyltransferase